jgi:hypothetical protein
MSLNIYRRCPARSLAFGASRFVSSSHLSVGSMYPRSYSCAARLPCSTFRSPDSSNIPKLRFGSGFSSRFGARIASDTSWQRSCTYFTRLGCADVLFTKQLMHWSMASSDGQRWQRCCFDATSIVPPQNPDSRSVPAFPKGQLFSSRVSGCQMLAGYSLSVCSFTPFVSFPSWVVVHMHSRRRRSFSHHPSLPHVMTHSLELGVGCG